MKKAFTAILWAGIILFSACKKDSLDRTDAAETAAPIEAPISVPFTSGFNYTTTKDVKFNIGLRTNNEQPLAGIVVEVFLPTAESKQPIFKGVTDKSGYIRGSVTLSSAVNELVVDPSYIGLMRNVRAVISDSNDLNLIIGGKDGYTGNIIADNLNFDKSSEPDYKTATYKTNGYQVNGLILTSWVYPGTYTAANAFVNNTTYPKALGRPVYLEGTADVLDASLLSYVNSSLPENQPLPSTHPQFFAANTVTTLNVTKTTDVYVTFVSEGASNMNTLAYYTFPTGTPPSTGESLLPILGAIDKITYIFPNASALGSSGGLKSGDKVKLGNFPAGTSIGFVLVQNGWNGNGVTTAGRTKFYSADSYNSNKLRQGVLLYDDVHKCFVSSFEDSGRDLVGTDNDFNDVVFYTTSSINDAIATTNVPLIDKGGDSDGDGVQDASDAFPNDPSRAFISYAPSKDVSGTILFENQWPKKGDYDMNDLVVSYRYTYEMNASNKVVNLIGDYTVLAAGSMFKHGFGVQLPVAASAVKSVTGQKIVSNYITLASNGVEAGQEKAVIIPFDNYDAMLPDANGGNMINTSLIRPTFNSLTATVKVSFVQPVSQEALRVSFLNPFLISGMERGREVHLMGYMPTDKANKDYFDTEDDATVPSQNRYYRSLDGLPFAISFTDKFSYPIELTNINKAYLFYTQWAQSNGNSYPDWFSNSSSTYRNTSKIFVR